MTKQERRVKEFSSGLARVGEHGRAYIHKLVYALFLIEKPPAPPPGGAEKPGREQRRAGGRGLRPHEGGAPA
jgi:hypothetical protein